MHVWLGNRVCMCGASTALLLLRMRLGGQHNLAVIVKPNVLQADQRWQHRSSLRCLFDVSEVRMLQVHNARFRHVIVLGLLPIACLLRVAVVA